MTLLLHRKMTQTVENIVSNPGHALLLVAPLGAGKYAVARFLAAKLLNIPEESLDACSNLLVIAATPDKKISIDEVRNIAHFLQLKPLGKHHQKRIIIIDHAEKLTLQAQNALLKTLEEPPENVVLVLTSPSIRSLLPTIVSRVRIINIPLPSQTEIITYFSQRKLDSSDINKASLMSGGLPGLMSELLVKNADHPLVAAALQARNILKSDAFERIALVDDLAKNRQLWKDMLYIFGQMAEAAIQQGNPSKVVSNKWIRILEAANIAADQEQSSIQLKLSILNFMLSI